MKRLLPLALLATAAPVVLTSAAARAGGRTVPVVVDKLAFGAIPSNLRVGDSIVWENRDLFRHSATAVGHFDVDLPPGAKRRMIFRGAGVLAFTCKYHPGMKGVIRVIR